MKNKKFKRLIILLWILFLFTIVSVPLTFYLVRIDFNGLFGGLPSLEALERPDPDLSSELFSADGQSLGKYFRTNRTPVTYEELSTELVNTLLVTEDRRFKRHPGIDLKGLVRAALGKLTFQFRGGGSTLTMQLAENLYKTDTENRGKLYRLGAIGPIITKIKEYMISVQLEKAYTKEEILAMYLNTVPFGSNAFGIKVAAKTFFNKLPSQLDYNESAILVGSINAPTRFNPVMNPENAMQKRREVLGNLKENGLITSAELDSMAVMPFGLKYKVDNQNEGLATYFRSVIRDFLLNWTREHGYDLYDDGLKIYTTIDSRMQIYAEEAVQQHMDTLQQIFNQHWGDKNPWIGEDGKELPNFLENAIQRTEYYRHLVSIYGKESDSVEIKLLEKRPMTVFTWDGEVDTLMNAYDSLKHYKRYLQAGFMAMDPTNGHIKAWVGGINHKYFKYDHVQQGKRQPGSTFKPVVYTAAVDNNYSPCLPVVDAKITFPNQGDGNEAWSPENSNGQYSGKTYTLRQAMARSINSITAYVMQSIGERTVVDYARRLGIKSELAAVPALCLGAGGDVSVYEMVAAYSTFVNKGVYTEPFYITRIEDQNGNVIQQFAPESKDALPEQTAYVMLHMLQGTTEPGGTAAGLSWTVKADNEIGAKTGTTQNGSDGWFIGVTHNLAGGAWVGGDDRSIRFREWYLGQGAKTAMPIWDLFMQKVYQDQTLGISKGPFDRPMKPIGIELDCSRYRTQTIPSDSVVYDVVNEDGMI